MTAVASLHALPRCVAAKGLLRSDCTYSTFTMMRKVLPPEEGKAAPSHKGESYFTAIRDLNTDSLAPPLTRHSPAEPTRVHGNQTSVLRVFNHSSDHLAILTSSFLLAIESLSES